MLTTQRSGYTQHCSCVVGTGIITHIAGADELDSSKIRLSSNPRHYNCCVVTMGTIGGPFWIVTRTQLQPGDILIRPSIQLTLRKWRQPTTETLWYSHTDAEMSSPWTPPGSPQWELPEEEPARETMTNLLALGYKLDPRKFVSLSHLLYSALHTLLRMSQADHPILEEAINPHNFRKQVVPTLLKRQMNTTGTKESNQETITTLELTQDPMWDRKWMEMLGQALHISFIVMDSAGNRTREIGTHTLRIHLCPQTSTHPPTPYTWLIPPTPPEENVFATLPVFTIPMSAPPPIICQCMAYVWEGQAPMSICRSCQLVTVREDTWTGRENGTKCTVPAGMKLRKMGSTYPSQADPQGLLQALHWALHPPPPTTGGRGTRSSERVSIAVVY